MMRQSRRIERLVLSVKPLSAGERQRLALDSGDAEFVDLAELSLGGLKRVRELRYSVHAREVVVATTAHNELAVFGNLLSALAWLVRAESRKIGNAEEGFHDVRNTLPTLLARLGLSTARGLLSVVVNSWNCRRAALAAPQLSVAETSSRCLYLRPTLQFGGQVGGSVGHVAGVANALASRGHCVRLVAMCEQPLLSPRIQQDVVEPSFPTAFLNELNRHRYHRLFVREALRAAAQFRPSYLYARYSLSDLTGPLLRRKLRVPLILEYNGSEVWTQRHWGEPLLFEAASARIEETNLRAADLVVVVSEEIRRQVVAVGVPEERVLFYPNCVDPQLFDPSRFDATSRVQMRGRLGLPQDSAVYTFVGTFGRWHGTDVLAQAIRRLLDQHPAWLESRRIHFLFVGDGLLAPRVREILGSGTLGPFVTLAGYRPQAETAAILAASDVLLSPHVPNADGSPFFGSPTKLFEYMAMGKPIVASDLAQIGSLLRGWTPSDPPSRLRPRTEASGILVEPGSVESLVEGIRRAAELSMAERRRLGEETRAAVLRWFTWDKNVEAVLGRLHDLSRRGGKEAEA